MTDLSPELANAFNASLASRDSRAMMALELRLGDHWAADAALAKRRRAKIDGLGIKDGCKPPPSTGPRGFTAVRALTKLRAKTILAYLRDHHTITCRKAGAITRMQDECARRLMNDMTAAGDICRTMMDGHANFYALPLPAGQAAQIGGEP